MIRTALAILLITVSATAASAAPDKAPPADAPYRFVGYSSSTSLLLGNVGIPALHGACQDAALGFGPDARMCTTEEFFLSTNAEGPGGPVDQGAWIHPTIVAGDGQQGIDFSGVHASNAHDLSCTGWASIGNTGMHVNPLGVFQRAACSPAPRRVTCCAPAQ